MDTFLVSKYQTSGMQKTVVAKLNYATDPSKYCMQLRLSYLSYNECDCSPHRGL